MALIKLTAIIDQISGKLNGTIFARNKGGNYVKRLSIPANPQTQHQQNVRNRFSYISKEWRNLTEEQRQSWREIAKVRTVRNRLGEERFLSGFQWFQKININSTLAGDGFRETPPPLVRFPFPKQMKTDLQYFPDEINIQLAVTAGNPNTCSLLIFATPVISKGIFNFRSRLKMITDTPLNSLISPSWYNIYQDYTRRFPLPSSPGRIGFAFKIISGISAMESPLLYDFVDF